MSGLNWGNPWVLANITLSIAVVVAGAWLLSRALQDRNRASPALMTPAEWGSLRLAPYMESLIYVAQLGLLANAVWALWSAQITWFPQLVLLAIKAALVTRSVAGVVARWHGFRAVWAIGERR
jgi:hypothetical protein